MHVIWGVIGLAAAGLAVAIIWLWNRRADRPLSEEVSVPAVVTHAARQDNGRLLMGFRAQNEESYRFEVPERLGRGLEVGQSGTLTFCGGDFVYFVQKDDPAA